MGDFQVAISGGFWVAIRAALERISKNNFQYKQPSDDKLILNDEVEEY